MRLGRLYTITSLSPKKRILFLKRAKQLDSRNPEPYKYLGIVYLDGFYQFDSAIKEIAEYVARKPEDGFGRNYLGYLYYCTKRYKAAISEFNKAVELKADNCYAFAKLARAYTSLYLNSSKIDPRRPGYKESAVEMFEKSSAVDTPDLRRINWLERFLLRKEILN
jgi:tetratricopeptide (TPR) repeat protein